MGQLQNRYGDVVFYFFIYFLLTSEMFKTCTHGYCHQTKFPVDKVWWLREAAQIGQTIIPLHVCEKSLKAHGDQIQETFVCLPNGE